MNAKIIKSRLSYRFDSIMCTLAMLLMILLSGCVFFTRAYRKEADVFFLFIAVILLLRHRNKIPLKIYKVVVFTITFLAINIFGNLDSLTISQYVAYLVTILEILCVAVVCSYFSAEELQNRYISIMVIICLVSLPCYWLQKNNLQLVHALARTDLVPEYSISWFHTWGWDYIFNRNACPFWEPGAFQGYIILAVLFILNGGYLKGNYIKLGILYLTILTTASTTGYILMAMTGCYMLLIYFRETNPKIKSRLFFVIRYIAIFVAALLAVQYILGSSVVVKKLTMPHESTSIRLFDIISSFEVALARPFFGYGMMGNKLFEAWAAVGRTGNSSGIMASMEFFGFLPAVAFLIFFMHKTTKVLNRLHKLFVLGVFFVLFMTETLIAYPVYLAFLFASSNQSTLKDNSLFASSTPATSNVLAQ